MLPIISRIESFYKKLSISKFFIFCAFFGSYIICANNFNKEIYQIDCIDSDEKSNLLLEKELIGEHAFTLQWIGWDFPGTVDMYKEMDLLICVGEQISKENKNEYIKIDGYIEVIDEKTFEFIGSIVTRIEYINEGNECLREGVFTFKISGKRKYWRMQEMQNPCEDVVDYVDIYF